MYQLEFSATRDRKFVCLGVKEAEMAQRGFWRGEKFFRIWAGKRLYSDVP